MDFSIIVITPERTVERETELINQLFIHGLARLHLRKPSFTLSDCRNYIKDIDKQYHSKISIHQKFELAEEFSAIGIHLKSTDRKNTKLIQTIHKRTEVTLSASFHSWLEIRENRQPYHYVFISPVFDSISKQGYQAAIDLSELNHTKIELLALGNRPPQIVGLGGVDAANVSLLAKAGFNGAAVLGAVWEADEPVKAFTKITEVVTLPLND